MSRARVHPALAVAALAVLAAVGFGVVRRESAPLRAATDDAAPGAAPADAAPARAGANVAAPASTQHVKVAFQLDPALTQGLYLGQRWVTPPVFDFAQPGAQFVVRAKAQRTDAAGERQDVSGDWAAGNPEMVAITREPDGVTLAVREAGDSDLVLLAAGERRVLHVHAERRPDAMRVRITQQ